MLGTFNCSMLDCIKSGSEACSNVVNHRKENIEDLLQHLGEGIHDLSEIVFVGSGTSSTAAITSKAFVEKVTHLKTSVAYPNDFLCNTYVYNPKALYVFTSQTGTSIVACEALNFIKEKGYYNVAVSEAATTKIAKTADSFISIDCGIEEYPMRTVGYVASVLTHMIMGCELGLKRGTLSQSDYDSLIEEASALSGNYLSVIDQAMDWMNHAKRKMLRSDVIIFTGADSLYGVSLEGAMKVWETPQIPSFGYEIEEGLHGPNYGYNPRHCVIVLNDGQREDRKCKALAGYMKDVMKNGFLIGEDSLDDEDFHFTPVTKHFNCIEFAPIVQVISYRLAEDQGRDLFKHHDNEVMNSYFKTHS